MDNDKLLLTVAVIAVIVSVVAAGVTYFSLASLVTRISGFATNTGTANLTVESTASINFTTNNINWGSGRVNDGAESAQLTTLETNNVTDGNWTLQTSGGLRIENIGNTNVSLDLATGKTADTFIGGTDPGYEWNVTNLEAGSCINASNLGVFTDVNNTGDGTRFCSVFQYLDNRDSIRIDLNLTVPSSSFTGALGDTITATATAV